MNIPVEAECLHAALRLVLRLTRNHQNAMLFAELGGPRILLTLTQSSSFPGFISLASLIFRHIIEEPSSLRYCMEKVQAMLIYFLFVFPEIGIFESGLPFQFSSLYEIISLLALFNSNVHKLYFGFFIMCDINILIFHTIDNSNSYTHLTTPPP